MTQQAADVLFYAGRRYLLLSTPALKRSHPHIITLEHKQYDLQSMAFSTACWRNYLGTWKIRNDKLYLTHLEGCYQLQGEEPLWAEWVTESLLLPDNFDAYCFDPEGYHSDNERKLVIEDGLLLCDKVVPITPLPERDLKDFTWDWD